MLHGHGKADADGRSVFKPVRRAKCLAIPSREGNLISDSENTDFHEICQDLFSVWNSSRIPAWSSMSDDRTRPSKGTIIAMNPFQRQFQITVPSSKPVRDRGLAMNDATRRRRGFQGKTFNKQAFYNCLILGVYDVESNRDLDPDELAERGLLAVLIDRGATELSRLIAADDAPVLPRGAKASVGRGAVAADSPRREPEPTPTPPVERRKPRGLIVPVRLLAANRVRRDDLRRDDRTQEVHQPSRRRPVP